MSGLTWPNSSHWPDPPTKWRVTGPTEWRAVVPGMDDPGTAGDGRGHLDMRPVRNQLASAEIDADPRHPGRSLALVEAGRQRGAIDQNIDRLSAPEAWLMFSSCRRPTSRPNCRGGQFMIR